MRFFVFLLGLLAALTPLANAAKPELAARITADRACADAMKDLDTVEMMRVTNKGTLDDVGRIARDGLKRNADCKDRDAQTFLRGMLTSESGLQVLFRQPSAGAKLLRSALPDLATCNEHRDVYGRVMGRRCASQLNENHTILTRLRQPY